MDTNEVKTTIEIDAKLLYLVKMKALQEGKTLKEVISESLTKELRVKEVKKEKKAIHIGGYNLGGVKGTLRRVDIYEDF